jgi:hypothetical protein
MGNQPLPTFEDFLKPETGKRKYVIKMPSGKYYAGETGTEHKEDRKDKARTYFNQADAQKAADSVGGSLETINNPF